MIKIDCDFPGGNIIVENINGDEVILKPDLRDTQGHWFYWYFRTQNAKGRKLKFKFNTNGCIIGATGPAVSLDKGKTWSWIDSIDDKSFEFAFENIDDVRFSVGMPYLQEHLDRFLLKYKDSEHLKLGTLCKTRKDRDVEMLHVGCIAHEPKIRIAMTARHHACEMMANYTQEGIIEGILNDDEIGRWFCDNVEFLIIPFVDKDGVEDGDQGKSRIPHDHNRDYFDMSIYETVIALKKYALSWHKGKIRFFLDMHCPYLVGGRNLELFFVGIPDDKMWTKVGQFSETLEEVQKKLIFNPENNLAYGLEWNVGSEGKTSSSWFANIVNDGISTSIEIPYAIAGGEIVNQTTANEFGHDLIVALYKYMRESIRL
ncbi:MAG: M14 family zinc carboxypeptidase [Candidatus Poribacteria bacterium]